MMSRPGILQNVPKDGFSVLDRINLIFKTVLIYLRAFA